MLIRKKPLFVFILVVSLGFILIFLAAYIMQEKLIFFPEKLSHGFQYHFPNRYEEVFFEVDDGISINALHFKVDNPKGVVFYSHGNAGSLRTWGLVADTFLSLQYDLLIYDYRGYGKSGGKVSERSLYNDAGVIYEKLKQQYGEQNIVVYGRSIGTGVASYVAAHHQPALLILESPYYNLPDLVQHLVPLLPKFFVKYQLGNDKYLPQCPCPVLVFHGTDDEVIYFESSKKLQQLFRKGDRLVAIAGGHHNDLSNFEKYHEELARALE